MTWDPNPEPNITGYRVFVGTAPGDYPESFDVPAHQTSFVFATGVPGLRYYFVVAAQSDLALWGAPSLEVSETIGGGADDSLTVMPAPKPPPTGGDGDSSAPIARAASSGLARLDVLTTGSRPLSALSVSAGGTGFVVEAGHHVRVFQADGLQSDDALVLDDDVEVRDIALDPAFDRNGMVFLAASRTRRGGGREITVERYRLLNGTLGEPSALVAGLPDDSDSRTVLAVAADGPLIVAQAGVVKAYSAEGRMPETSAGIPASSPGPAEPSSVAWDAAGHTVWVVGVDANGTTVQRLAAAGAAPTSFRLPATLGGDVAIAHIGASGHIRIVGVSPQALTEFDPEARTATTLAVDLAKYGRPILLAAPPTGGAPQWFVVLRQTALDGSSSDTILRVSAPTAGLPIEQ